MDRKMEMTTIDMQEHDWRENLECNQTYVDRPDWHDTWVNKSAKKHDDAVDRGELPPLDQATVMFGITALVVTAIIIVGTLL